MDKKKGSRVSGVQKKAGRSRALRVLEKRAKRTAKDTVFRDLFSIRRYLLLLYQALHPEDLETRAEDLRIVTIKNVLTDQLYNDLGFTVGGRLIVLIEAQATWSSNILLRILLYWVQSFQEMLQTSRANLYGSKKIFFPKPEFYVIYTGTQPHPEWLTLKEEFFAGEDCPFLDVKVKVLSPEEGNDIISQYVAFSRVYDRQVRKYGRCPRAVEETIRICQDQDILKEYLEERKAEVFRMVCRLFDQDYVIERYGDEREEKGIKKGEQKGQLTILSEFVKDGIISLSEAARRAGLTAAEFTHQVEELGCALQ